MSEQKEWKYCVVGNIVRTHLDESGVPRNGTLTYRGGSKVFLEGKFWRPDRETITVLGICRGNRWLVKDTPVALIENVRVSRVYKPRVLEIMNNWECEELWWHNTAEDKKEAEEFVSAWNAKFPPEEKLSTDFS